MKAARGDGRHSRSQGVVSRIRGGAGPGPDAVSHFAPACVSGILRVEPGPRQGIWTEVRGLFLLALSDRPDRTDGRPAGLGPVGLAAGRAGRVRASSDPGGRRGTGCVAVRPRSPLRNRSAASDSCRFGSFYEVAGVKPRARIFCLVPIEFPPNTDDDRLESPAGSPRGTRRRLVPLTPRIDHKVT